MEKLLTQNGGNFKPDFGWDPITFNPSSDTLNWHKVINGTSEKSNNEKIYDTFKGIKAKN